MPILKCGVDTCTYYYDNRCSKSMIKVTGFDANKEDETNCSSYHRKDRIAFDSYNLEIGTIDDIITEYLSVNCDAVNCLYNRNLLCYAKDIKIDGTNAKKYIDTFCSSFVNK